jgi:hypothetical protein
MVVIALHQRPSHGLGHPGPYAGFAATGDPHDDNRIHITLYFLDSAIQLKPKKCRI